MQFLNLSELGIGTAVGFALYKPIYDNNKEEINEIIGYLGFLYKKIGLFKKSKIYICAEPLSVNLIGEREWKSMYEFVEIVRIPELLDYYRSQGLNFTKYMK